MATSYNVMGESSGSVPESKKGVFLEALSILKAQGVVIDAACLQKSAIRIYNSFDNAVNPFYPLAYSLLHSSGVDINVKCLSETTKKIYPFDNAVNPFYPLAYSLLHSSGVDINVKCLSETTKKIYP